MYLSVDGGGSKLRMLLADEGLNPVGYWEAGGVNTNFVSDNNVKRAFEEAVEGCVPMGAVLRHVCSSILCRRDFLENPLRQRANAAAWHWLQEGEMGLLAAVGQKKGILALSGTGSHAFCMDGEWCATVGGLGMLLGDEGSGYDIGRKGLMAAVHAYDGRGGSPELLALLMEKWKLPRKDLTSHLYRRVAESASPRALIASFAAAVSEAACAGDTAGRNIYEQAGLDMAQQVNALIGKLPTSAQALLACPITLCGGAWKGSASMFRAFRRGVLAKYPGVSIVWPMFDAVAGGLLDAAIRDGLEIRSAIERLKANLPDLVYRKPDDWSDSDDG